MYNFIYIIIYIYIIFGKRSNTFLKRDMPLNSVCLDPPAEPHGELLQLVGQCVPRLTLASAGVTRQHIYIYILMCFLGYLAIETEQKKHESPKSFLKQISRDQRTRGSKDIVMPLHCRNVPIPDVARASCKSVCVWD